MHSNQKLTKIIAGRTISGTSQGDGPPSNSNAAATGGKLLKVPQEGTGLHLVLADGFRVQVQP